MEDRGEEAEVYVMRDGDEEDATVNVVEQFTMAEEKIRVEEVLPTPTE